VRQSIQEAGNKLKALLELFLHFLLESHL
jgi:hypothetical protein